MNAIYRAVTTKNGQPQRVVETETSIETAMDYVLRAYLELSQKPGFEAFKTPDNKFAVFSDGTTRLELSVVAL